MIERATHQDGLSPGDTCNDGPLPAAIHTHTHTQREREMRRGKRRGEKLGGKRQGVGKKRKRRMWRCIPPPSDNGIYYNPSNREIMCDAVHPSNINMLMMISCGIQFRFDGISSSFSVAMGVESFLGFWNREEGGGGGEERGFSDGMETTFQGEK